MFYPRGQVNLMAWIVVRGGLLLLLLLLPPLCLSRCRVSRDQQVVPGSQVRDNKLR